MKKRLVSVLTVITMIICTFSICANAVGDVINFSRDDLNLYVGQNYQLSLTADAEISEYISSDPKIVSVSVTGVVRALSLGSSVITVRDTKGNEAHCSVNVIDGDSPTGVEIETQSISLTEGESYALKAKVLPEDTEDPRLYYTSSDSSVARVDKNGHIKAVKAGVAVITVESSSAAISSKCIVKVIAKSTQGSVAVSIDGVLYTIAGEKKNNMVIQLSNDKESLETTTDKDGTFYFDDIVQGTYTLSVYKGKVTENSVAMGQITVGSYDMFISCIINDDELVILYKNETEGKDKVSDITLGQKYLTLDTGATYDMTFKVTPSTASLPKIKGTSSNEDVATVDVDGRITAHEEGVATLTFKTADGKISKTCQVTVTSENSNTYSLLIIIVELAVILLIVIVFTLSYKRYTRQREIEEGLIPDTKD